MRTVLQYHIKCGLLEIGTNNTGSNLVELVSMTLKARNKFSQISEMIKAAFVVLLSFQLFRDILGL